MDNIAYTNPLETVQFISICSYLYALSDFLFIENYLSEVDQNKQILVVNALYDYLEDYHNNQTMKLKLIRYLLKGSDLYGEEESENVDIVFVNTMFDHIIKSLVFNKYGNIYGFLAEVVRKTQNLQLDILFKEILSNLQTATFENEYGEASRLTSLAANRIFTDIILPLFPQSKRNINLLSLDYILAQAGISYLKPGKINTAYYTDFENINSTVLDQENLFDEYLITGLIIRKNHINNNRSLSNLRAFALPALLVYVSTAFLQNENITNIIYDPYYLKAVYEELFSYIDSSFDEIAGKLVNDTNYQLHTVLLKFYKLLANVNNLLNIYCNHLTSAGPIQLTTSSLIHECLKEFILQSMSESLTNYINEIGEIFQKHDLKSIQQSFGEPLLKSLKSANVNIDLLAPTDNVVLGIFDNATRLPYDLFNFYYPENETTEYYALMRENYTTNLIKIADNTENFKENIGVDIQTLLNHRFHRVHLKLVNQSLDVFWKEFIAYKKLRLKSYLSFTDSDRRKGDWWKEFGLTLVPFYQSNIENAPDNSHIQCVGGFDDIKYFNELPNNISLLIFQEKTRTLLSSIGTTIKTIYLKNITDELSDYTIKLNTKKPIQLQNNTNTMEHFEKLSLHLEEPGFEIESITNDNLMFLNLIISELQNKKLYPFISVKNYLHNILIFKSNFSRQINILGNRVKRILYIKSKNSITNTGYGYKFIYSAPNKTAHLRTDFEVNKKMFLSLNHTKPNGELMYSIIQIDNFEHGQFYIFEINNQLRKSISAAKFLGIYVYFIDEKKCYENVSEGIHLVNLLQCSLLERFNETKRHMTECIQVALTRNSNLSKQLVMETMKLYAFPDEGRMDLKFVEDWVNNTDLTLPEWSKQYIIENHALFFKLKNDIKLEVNTLTNFDGTFKIDSIYHFRDRQKIESGTSMEKIIENFNVEDARFVVSFEDYYAIRNFVTTGYTRISDSTHEASFMKIALYKLAIRQSEDPDNEFEKILWRTETMPIDIINRTFTLGKIHTLKKFLTTYTTNVSAINFATVAKPGYKNILYEIKFTQPYFRAKVKQFYYFNEITPILLPGIKFSIVSVRETHFTKIGDCLVVELMYNHTSEKKYEWNLSIMKEITRIWSKL
ncbi:uncharacterized protein LOC127280336 isoform X1 [Leptopilina boulardi]|uniref:uncharacterized protein LOC127280336 isoform X1 n=1 Tax=Leptopilina boulardi TaxID=63433 RepID=UPI0021F64027|nr:uncharacterized protein LOC127280336 isoform X1 [Leptopilina boulardi]